MRWFNDNIICCHHHCHTCFSNKVKNQRITYYQSFQQINFYSFFQYLVLSYIGGLSTAILAIIQIFVNFYNQYAFEKQFTQKIFNSKIDNNPQSPNRNEQNQKKQQQSHVNKNDSKLTAFCNWLKDKLCCCCKSNPWAQAYKQQLTKQLDIQTIIKKINLFQNVLLKLVATSYLRQEINDIKKYDIQKAKKFRQVFDVFEKSEIESDQIQNQGNQGNQNMEKLDEYHDKNINKNEEKQYQGPLQINLQLNYQSNEQINQRQQNYQQKVDDNFKKQSLNTNKKIKTNSYNDNYLETNSGFMKEEGQIQSIYNNKERKRKAAKILEIILKRTIAFKRYHDLLHY